MDRPSAKYEIIHSIVSQKDNLQNVKELCNIAGVSRSGYYNWLASEDKRLEREAKDKHDFELILNAYSFRGYDKGIRGIHMRLKLYPIKWTHLFHTQTVSHSANPPFLKRFFVSPRLAWHILVCDFTLFQTKKPHPFCQKGWENAKFF